MYSNQVARKHVKHKTESVEASDSLVPTDNTLLRKSESAVHNDNKKPSLLLSILGEEDMFEDDWDAHDISDINKSFKKLKESCVKMRRIAHDITETDHVATDCPVSQEIMTEDAIEWQDNTLLEKALSPCNNDASMKDILEHSNQIGLFDEYNSNGLSQSLASEFIPSSHKISPNTHLSTDVQLSITSLKPRPTINININSSKNLQLSIDKTDIECRKIRNTNSAKDHPFYGLPHEVKKLIQQIKGIEKLYQWQDECLKLEAVKNRRNLIYALPTSGGKTLVAEILMLKEVVCNKRNAIFILPFVAIVQEKVHSMAPFALELGFLIEEYAAVKGQLPPKKRRKKNSIYICTIEKSLGLINSLLEMKRFHEIGIIVVDELHLLGESGGRGATLEGLLTKVMFVNENVHIIGMSATIGNLEEIAQFLNADLYAKNFRPVEIKEYVKCEDNIWLLDPRAEDVLTDMKTLNYHYSRGAATLDPDKIGGLVADVVPQDSCLVFCSSRKNCENVAILLTKVLPKSLMEHKKGEKEKLLNILKTEEGLCSILRETIKFGVAYHHSGLTAEERRLLEDAYREGILCVICCTSTLAAGVNLPARRVILRSPYVGSQFLNISRYKQMIGRAGRAGMGDMGESILICKNTELPKVKTLVTSKMDDSLSTLHIEKDKGVNNLILSSILLSVATTRAQMHKLMSKSLLSIQEKRLDVNVKQITDEAISALLKYGVIKVKKHKAFDDVKPNVSVVIPSQEITDSKQSGCKEKKMVILTNETELELCDLGKAAMKGSIDLHSAYTLYEDLKTAQKRLILVDYLHLLYLITPYSVVSQIKPVFSVYYDVILHLSPNEMETARLLGINEAAANKLRDGIIPKNVETRVVHRFYVTLILHDLWNQRSIFPVAEKYQVNRGIVQSLLTSVSSFASSVVRFCQELNEFWAFAELFDTFSKKLFYCCPAELETLMELPLVKIGRARQFYKAGYKTLQSIAKADPKDLQEKIPYLGKKAIAQIISAANLLILEKVENLRDEAEDFLDGINITRLDT